MLVEYPGSFWLGKGLVSRLDIAKVGHMEFMLELGLPLALDIWQGWPSYDNDDFEAGLAVIARVGYG